MPYHISPPTDSAAFPPPFVLASTPASRDFLDAFGVTHVVNVTKASEVPLFFDDVPIGAAGMVRLTHRRVPVDDLETENIYMRFAVRESAGDHGR